jgi:hypothetical protein
MFQSRKCPRRRFPAEAGVRATVEGFREDFRASTCAGTTRRLNADERHRRANRTGCLANAESDGGVPPSDKIICQDGARLALICVNTNASQRQRGNFSR